MDWKPAGLVLLALGGSLDPCAAAAVQTPLPALASVARARPEDPAPPQIPVVVAGKSVVWPPLRLYVRQDIVRDTEAPRSADTRFLDTTLLLAWPQVHAALTLGSFDSGLEVGGYIRDRRGSVYGLVGRRRVGARVENTSLELHTQQKLGRTVLGGGFKFFWPDHPAQSPNLTYIPTLGCDVYYGDYSYASIFVSRDPRPDTGTTFRLVNRLARERAAAEVSIAPRTDGVVNWGFQLRYDVFFVGMAQEDDYDFTVMNRGLFFFGFQYDLRP